MPVRSVGIVLPAPEHNADRPDFLPEFSHWQGAQTARTNETLPSGPGIAHLLLRAGSAVPGPNRHHRFISHLSHAMNFSLIRRFASFIPALIAAPVAVRAQSDAFAEATVITTLPVTGSNAGATKEAGEPDHGSNPGGASVWYSWTATATGHYRVDLLGSGFDTLLGLYTGAGVDNLNVLALNDDRPAGGGTTSAAVVYVRAGETILVAVDGYSDEEGGVPDAGPFNLDIVPLPAAEVPPANDLFGSAASLGNSATATATVNNTYGSREVGEPMIEALPGGSSLWWTWTAPATGDVIIDTAGTGFDTLLGVYTGSTMDALTLVASNDNDGALVTSKVTLPAVAGTLYRIAADARSAGLRVPQGALTIRIGDAGGDPTPPANDNFAAAALITTLPVTGSTALATKEAGEPNHGNNPGGLSIWYSWTASSPGHYRVDLLGSSFDTLLGVYTGSDVATLQPVTQNDDRGGGGASSQVVVYALAGQQFYIAVDGYRAGAAGTPASGNVTLNITPLPAAEVPPPNDLFANAASLAALTSAVVSQSTVYGSREAGEPIIAGVVGASSLWWKWTAPASAEVQITTAGTTFNTLLAVYTGSSLNALSLVASNDNAGALTTSRVVFNAIAGTEYRIAADVNNAAITTPSGLLRLQLTSNIYISTLIQFGSTWAWLSPAGGVDPAGTDPDFDTTWHTAAAYDGPAFSAPGAAILAYGGLTYGATATTITDPGTGNRYSAYFRRSFTAPADQAVLKAEVLADDGAIIYIDGVERARVNMDLLAADTFTLFALDADATETTTVTVDLGAITAGPHEIAVSLHNSATDSSDLGFDLRLFTDTTPPPVDFVLGSGGAFTGFEEPVVGASSYFFGSNGATELGWTATGGLVQDPAAHPAAGGTAPTSKFFLLNAARTAPFRSDRISLAGLTDEQKSTIIASANVRTLINTAVSTSTFETPDDLTISLEGSTDGTTFTVLTDILAFTTGGTPDNLLAISAATGNYFTFAINPGFVSAETSFLRLVINGGDDSGSEYIYIDDLRISLAGPPDPAADDDGDGQTNASEAFAGTDPSDPSSVLRVSSATPGATGLSLSFPGIAGKVYQVEYSATLAGTWTVLRDDITPAVTGPVDVADLVLPAGSAGFVRVRVKP